MSENMQESSQIYCFFAFLCRQASCIADISRTTAATMSIKYSDQTVSYILIAHRFHISCSNNNIITLVACVVDR